MGIALLVGFNYYDGAIEKQLQSITSSQQLITELTNKTLIDRLDGIKQDTIFLRDSINDELDNTGLSSASIARLTNIFKNMMQSHQNAYAQARYIDINGYEIIRIDNYNGVTSVIAENELQDKSNRYYFQETLILPADQIYISPFDLNVEGNRIEIPFRPMMRFSIPVVDAQRNRRGVVVLNYDGSQLLRDLIQINNDERMQTWLINQEGYWLLGPSNSMEWGFMFADKNNVTMPNLYPEIWNNVFQGSAEIQSVMSDQGIYSHNTIDIYTELGESKLEHGQEYVFYNLTLLPAANMESIKQHQLQILFPYIIMTLLAGTVLSLWLAVLLKHRNDANQQIRRLEVLQRAQQQFRIAVEASPSAMFAIDKHEVISMANTMAEQIFGYDKGTLNGKHLAELIPDRFRELHKHHVDTFTESPSNRSMGMGRELVALTKTGEEIPVEIGLNNIDIDGQLLTLVSVLNISQRRILEKRLNDTLNRLDMAVNIAGIGIWRWRLSASKMVWDKRTYEILGVSSHEEASFEQWRQCIHPDDLHRIENEFLKQARHGSQLNEEYRIDHQGITHWVKIIATVDLDNDGKTEIMNGIIMDITESRNLLEKIRTLNTELEARVARRTEELKTANAELNAFAYSVSHDLRAPLRALDGFSRLVAQKYSEKLDEVGIDYLERIQRASQHMGALIDDLLMLSRISRAELVKRDFNISELATETIRRLHEQAPERSVAIDIEAGLTAHGDPDLAKILLNNLLGNAWKFTSKTTNPKITFGKSEYKNRSMFFIKDNGAGFDMAYASKLFAPFQRLHAASDYSGTGIGLATVQRVISKHNGSIEAVSEPDKGATFYFSLEH